MDKKAFKNLLTEKVLLGDGAVGTMLYGRGVFVNACFDELSRTSPDLIRQVHEGYVSVGVDFIETNTFGANAVKLGKYGLADVTAEINSAGVAIAKECAGEEVMVAGAMGPIGNAASGLGAISPKEASLAFAEQASVLASGGVDFIILETFSMIDELTLAVKSVSDVTDLPIVAQVAVGTGGGSFPVLNHQLTDPDDFIEEMIQLSSLDAVDAVGLNCSLGPAAMLDCVKLLTAAVNKPVTVQPNAGLPREVDGRSIYMTTPEYMAEYAKRFFNVGARVIGGCCGTTPGHIREMAKAVRAMDRAEVKSVAVKAIAAKPKKGREPAEPVPIAECSRIGALLDTGELITSVELTPPVGGQLGKILEKVTLLKEHGIHAVNIPDGPRASSRMSPLAMAAKIQEVGGIEPILHVCCRDRNLIGLQSDMMGAQLLGIRNVLIITGDPPKLGDYPDATAVFDLDSVALTRVVSNLNRGVDIGGNVFKPPLSMTVSVGANPVAVDLEREVTRFEAKVTAGAQYAITQPVFDPSAFIEFLERTNAFRIPLVAGIWPFSSYKNAEFMANEVPGVVVPKPLLTRMAKAKTKEAGREIGIEIAREMVETLKPHVAGFAVSAPFGNVQIPLAVLGKREG